MVSDGEVGVVRLERVLRAAEDDAAVVGVVLPGKEVCVLPDLHGQVVLDICEWEQGDLPERLVGFQEVRVRGVF